jgi:hypothetical protein
MQDARTDPPASRSDAASRLVRNLLTDTAAGRDGVIAVEPRVGATPRNANAVWLDASVTESACHSRWRAGALERLEAVVEALAERRARSNRLSRFGSGKRAPTPRLTSPVQP